MSKRDTVLADARELSVFDVDWLVDHLLSISERRHRNRRELHASEHSRAAIDILDDRSCTDDSCRLDKKRRCRSCRLRDVLPPPSGEWKIPAMAPGRFTAWEKSAVEFYEETVAHPACQHCGQGYSAIDYIDWLRPDVVRRNAA